MKVKKFTLDNFSQREYAQQIHDKFFDKNSDGDIQYLLAFMYSYDMIEKKKLEKIEKLFEKIETSMYKAIKDHDTKIVNQLNKLK